MDKVLEVHICKKIPAVIILSAFLTMTGTQMFAVSRIKADGKTVKDRLTFIADDNGDMEARKFFEEEVLKDN